MCFCNFSEQYSVRSVVKSCISFGSWIWKWHHTQIIKQLLNVVALKPKASTSWLQASCHFTCWTPKEDVSKLMILHWLNERSVRGLFLKLLLLFAWGDYFRVQRDFYFLLLRLGEKKKSRYLIWNVWTVKDSFDLPQRLEPGFENDVTFEF